MRRRWHDRAFLLGSDGRYETVAFTRERLDELRILRRITKSFAKAEDRFVEAAVEIDKGACWPKPADEILSRHQFAGSLEEGEQDLEGLLAELGLRAIAGDLTGA
jgi:hypothetical protein